MINYNPLQIWVPNAIGFVVSGIQLVMFFTIGAEKVKRRFKKWKRSPRKEIGRVSAKLRGAGERRRSSSGGGSPENKTPGVERPSNFQDDGGASNQNFSIDPSTLFGDEDSSERLGRGRSRGGDTGDNREQTPRRRSTVRSEDKVEDGGHWLDDEDGHWTETESEEDDSEAELDDKI